MPVYSNRAERRTKQYESIRWITWITVWKCSKGWRPSEKKSKAVWIFAALGIVVVAAAAIYGLYRFFAPDYLEDFEDDFDDDFDDDFFEDEEEKEADDEAKADEAEDAITDDMTEE